MSDEAREGFFEALLDDDADQLYERAPCGYLSTRPDGVIVKVNQTFLSLSGYRREELVGCRTFAQLLSPGGQIYHETHYAPLLQMQGSVREIALDIVRADGSRLPVLVNSVLDHTAAGDPVMARTAVFDATERREYERELLRAKDRAEQSEARATALARTLQQTLIPPEPPHIPGLDIAAAYRPAGDGEEVGGDFYDIFATGPGDWVVVIGDVCGKGVEAAVITALVRHTLRAVAVGVAKPGDMLEAINSALLRHGTERFCTVVLLRLRRENGSWTACVSCAGHPQPLLIRAGSAPERVAEPGSLLGVLEQPVFHDHELQLDPGDAVVLYTDGVTEGRRGRELYGDERLVAAVSAHEGSAAALVQGVLDEVLVFQGNRPRDDIAVVAVQVPVGRAED